MKIAYFIIIHNNFVQFSWLMDAIYTDDDLFMIHIDKKSAPSFFKQVHEYVDRRPNIKFLPSHNVIRFGWSVVDIELRAIQTLVSSKDKWKYCINLSGQDYPIKSIGDIKARLIAEWPRNFVEVWPFTKMIEHDPNDRHLARKLAFEMFGKVVTTPIRLPFPKTIDVKYKGAQWFMLTRDFCEWFLCSQITTQISRLLKYTWTPDELFFQALIMNSPYRNTLAEHYGREIIWPGNTASPKTLTMEDYDTLKTSSALFARKFDERMDRQILLSLARDQGYQMPQHAVSCP